MIFFSVAQPVKKNLIQGCFINDTETRFVDKAEPTDPTRREDFWIYTLKTRYPHGLNSIDSYN